MGRQRKQRRQPHGLAWHWRQTDCWYSRQPGTNKRMPLLDETGARIRGKENKEVGELALARERLSWYENTRGPLTGTGQWLVAKVCSEYIEFCDRGLANGSTSKGHRDSSVASRVAVPSAVRLRLLQFKSGLGPSVCHGDNRGLPRRAEADCGLRLPPVPPGTNGNRCVLSCSPSCWS